MQNYTRWDRQNCIWPFVFEHILWKLFFGLDHVCGKATEMPLQERDKSPDFMRKVGIKAMFFCRRRCENKSFVGKVPRRRRGGEWDWRERWGVLQTGPNSLWVPWGHKGISQWPEQLVQPFLPACVFNTRLLYMGIFMSSFHTTYIPIRLGSGFTCIHAVSRWHR